MKDNDYYVASLDRYGAMDKKVITYRKKVSIEWIHMKLLGEGMLWIEGKGIF